MNALKYSSLPSQYTDRIGIISRNSSTSTSNSGDKGAWSEMHASLQPPGAGFLSGELAIPVRTSEQPEMRRRESATKNAGADGANSVQGNSPFSSFSSSSAPCDTIDPASASYISRVTSTSSGGDAGVGSLFVELSGPDEETQAISELKAKQRPKPKRSKATVEKAQRFQKFTRLVSKKRR
jgi:hypothetical protein